MKKSNQFGFIAASVCCLAWLGAPAWAADPKPPSAKPSLTVTLTTPQSQNMAQRLQANGSLAAWQEALIGAEANGLKITEVRVNVGDRVQRGDVLASLQSDTLRAELAQAEATLAEATAHAQDAKAQAERARSLQQQGFFSSAQLSQTLAAEASATARLQSARALVQLQNVRLSQTQVRAPDAGVISARQATVGSVVAAGTELFRLIRQGRIEWRAEVAAAELGRVQVGAPVQVTAASGQVLQGKVRMVAPSVDAQTRNALVYVDLTSAHGSARPGMFAQGELALGQSQALTVPQIISLILAPNVTDQSPCEEAIKSAEAEVWRKTDPAAQARANEVVRQLSDAIENYEKAAAKATAAGNAKKAAEALESAAARRVWLAEAEKGLAEFN